MIIASKAALGSQQKWGFEAQSLAGRLELRGLSVVTGKYSWVLAQGGSPNVKILIGSKLGCYTRRGSV